MGGIDLELWDAFGNFLYSTYYTSTGFGSNYLPLAGLQLYDSSGTLLATDEGVSNVHQIDLTDLDLDRYNLSAGETYYLKVFGYNDATNLSYILTVDAPFNTVTGDWSENNNSEPDTYEEAKDLGIINRLFNQGNLSISADDDDNDNNNDVDWFEFEIDAKGGLGDAVGINFNHQQGDLDIELYGSNGTTLLDDSASVSNNEEISLNGRDAGVYYLKVYGYNGATNPEYSLYINAPENTDGDWAEKHGSLTDNNSRPNAYDLRNIEGLQTWDTFSIHYNRRENNQNETDQNKTDVDWFKFNLLETATADDFVSILFDNTQGVQVIMDNKVSVFLPLVRHNLISIILMVALEVSPFISKEVKVLPSNVNIAVLWDQSERGETYSTAGSPKWGTTGQAIIQADTNFDVITTTFDTSIGEKNTGDPQSLIDFADWAKTAAPAENYALIMWNHGGGELGGFNTDNYDNHAPDRLYTDELTFALGKLKNTYNIDFNLLAFDACLMAMAEVAYALRDYTDILVASEEAEEGSGYDYTTAFSAMFGDASLVTPEALASSLVDSFQQQYQGNRRGWDTHSAINLDNGLLDTLVTKLNDFTTAAINLTNDSDWDIIKNARDNASSFFPAPYYRDLGQFLEAIINSVSNTFPTTLKDAASDAFNALQSLVIDRRNNQGLSVYLPDNGDLDSGYTDRNSIFLDETGWDDFLNAFSTNGSSNRSVVPLDWAEANDVAARAFNFNTLTGSGHQFTGLSLHNEEDQDYYRFQLSADGTESHNLTVNSQENLTFNIYDPTERDTPLKTPTPTNGQTVDLFGLNANQEYLLQVDSQSVVSDYSITINAPGTVQNSNDWGRGNIIPTKAEDLGVITAQEWFTGLQVDNANPDWFEFELAKVSEDDLLPITVIINPTTNQTITAQLFDPSDNNNAIASQTGTGEIQLTTPNPQPGEAYQLKVSGDSSGNATAYSLVFEPTSSIVSPTFAVDDSFSVSEDSSTVSLNIQDNDTFDGKCVQNSYIRY